METILKVKKLSDSAIIPSYDHPGDSGMGLYNAGETYIIPPGRRVLVPTGVACSVEPGYEIQIRARSGLCIKHGITVLNGIGTVDSSYRGELKVILINHSDKKFSVLPGMKIAQLVVTPVAIAQVKEVESLEDTSRGDGGFGSTGMGIKV